MTRTTTPVASARPKRVPIGKGDRLNIKNKDENFSYRIVNDVDDRVSRFMEAGYEIVPSEQVASLGTKRVDDASALGSAANFSVGKGVKAVVMRIQKEYALEDARTKQAEINALEQTMVSEQRRKADYGEIG